MKNNNSQIVKKDIISSYNLARNCSKEFVESVPQIFGGRFNGFGTYDINQPNGATHWVLVSGKDLDDHLQLLHNLETKYPEAMQKFVKDRGKTKIVHDFTFENLKYITTQ